MSDVVFSIYSFYFSMTRLCKRKEIKLLYIYIYIYNQNQIAQVWKWSLAIWASKFLPLFFGRWNPHLTCAQLRAVYRACLKPQSCLPIDNIEKVVWCHHPFSTMTRMRNHTLLRTLSWLFQQLFLMLHLKHTKLHCFFVPS